MINLKKSKIKIPRWLIVVILVCCAFAPAIWTKQNWMNPINVSVDSGLQVPRGTSTASPWINRDSIGQVMFRTTDAKFLGRFTPTVFKPFATEDSVLNLRQYVFTNFSPRDSLTTMTLDKVLRNGNQSSFLPGIRFTDSAYVRMDKFTDYGLMRFYSTGDGADNSSLIFEYGDNAISNPYEGIIFLGDNSNSVAPKAYDTIMRMNSWGLISKKGMIIGATITYAQPNSTLQVNGSFSSAVQDITANTTLANVHKITVSNTSNITITLPAPSTCRGREYIFKKITNNSNTVTLVATGGALVEDGASYTFGTYLSARRIWSDGGRWWVE